jgi:hypothetical protein
MVDPFAARIRLLQRTAQAEAGGCLGPVVEEGTEGRPALLVSSRGQRGDGGAVVGEIAADHLPATRLAARDVELPRQPQRRVYRLRAAAGEEDARQRIGEPALPQPLHQRQPTGRGEDRHHVGGLPHGGRGGLHHLAPTVPDIGHDGPAGGVEDRPPVGSVQVRALGPLDGEGDGAGPGHEGEALEPVGVHRERVTGAPACCQVARSARRNSSPRTHRLSSARWVTSLCSRPRMASTTSVQRA